MIVKARLSALTDATWHEYALRFGLGGIATVVTGLIASKFGPVTGGLFLAFPAIFCASATLIEKHERERKQKAGLRGERRGKEAAALDAAGAALGSFGLLAFAAVIWSLLPVAATAWAFAGASGAWFVVSISLWWGCRYVRRRPVHGDQAHVARAGSRSRRRPGT
jgi:hypothetical protein